MGGSKEELAAREALIADVRTGLAASPKRLPPRWFYDDAGSRLFEDITRLPEYYQTRTEAAILRACAGEMARCVQPEALVELGSGSSTKTRILIEACRAAGALRWFIPFDVSSEIVCQAAEALARDFPGLEVRPVLGDFNRDLASIRRLGRQLVLFLGSTIGNLEDEERHAFLVGVRELLRDGDAFLLGVDLIKDEGELVRAYDDRQGVTAAFNRNMLAVINRELGADFDLAAFEHVALYERELHRIEMRLRSTRDQWVTIPAIPTHAHFATGEEMLTEISVKFSRELIRRAFTGAGLALEAWYTDESERFALALGVPTSPAS